MASQLLALDGRLTVDPQLVVDTAVPTGSTAQTFALSRTVAMHTGLPVVSVASPSAYAVLPSCVTRGSYLFMRTNAAIIVRLTMIDTPSNLVSVVHVNSMLTMDFADAHLLVSVEVKGSALVEYMVAGDL